MSENDIGAEGRSPFLNLADLAKRWGITEAETMEIVRRRGVPFNRMTAAIARIKKDKLRFSLPAIEEWERATRERLAGGSGAAVPAPQPPPAGKGKSKTRLGNWRESTSSAG